MRKVLGVSLGVASLLTAALPALATQAVGQDVSSSASATYVRWVITERKGSEDSIQAAEIILFNGGVPLANTGNDGSIIVTNPGGSSPGGEGPAQGYDGDNETKWLDFNFRDSFDGTVGQSILVIQFPMAVIFDSYSWVTANDWTDRDPVSWILEVSSDGTNWTIVDTQSDVIVTEERLTIVGPFPVSGGGSGSDFGNAKSELATSGPLANRDVVLSLEPARTRGYIK